MVTTRAGSGKKGSAFNNLSSPSSSQRPPRPTTPGTGGRATATPRSRRGGTSIGSEGSGNTRPDYSSDEFEYSDTDSVAVGSTETGTSARSSTSEVAKRKARQKIPFNVEKQVLIDIEAAGGILLYKEGKTQGLADILEKRTLYGERGGDLRKRITRRIETIERRWLSKPGGFAKYLSYLRKLRVPAATNQTAARFDAVLEETEPTAALPASIKTSKEQSLEETVSDLDEATSKEEPPVTKRKTTHLRGSSEEPKKPKARARSFVSIGSSRNTMSGEVPVIEVDESKWNQGEGIKICSFSSHKFGGKQYRGYEISVSVDPRDLDQYCLEGRNGVKPNHEFVITKPEIEAPFWKSKKTYDSAQKHDAVRDGHNIAVTSYKKVKDEDKKQKLVLRFDSKMKLTDRQFLSPDEAQDDPMIKQQLIMGKVKTGFKVRDKDLKTHTFLLQWYLCDMSSEQDIEGNTAKRRKGQDLIDEAGENYSEEDDDFGDY